MDIVILTLFPDMINAYISDSIIGRGVQSKKLNINVINIRDYAFNKHNSVDDYTYGGGAGMLMQAEPVYLSIQAAKELIGDDAKVIYLSPIGKVLNQETVEKMASTCNKYILLCGHYEGIDERVLEECVDEYVSIGDYVLTGGELPALVLLDSIARFVPGVLHNDTSTDFESLQDNLLEYPQYSRPEEWHGKKVPQILLSGHHVNIEKWRREQSLIRTKENRPDLFEKVELNKNDIKFLKNLGELDIEKEKNNK